MRNDIDEVIERHHLELQKVKIGLRFLTRKVSDLDQSVSFLKSLKHDTFLSHDISNIEIAEDNHSYHLYEEVNNAYDHLKKQFDEFMSKQDDMEWAAQLNILNHHNFSQRIPLQTCRHCGQKYL